MNKVFSLFKFFSTLLFVLFIHKTDTTAQEPLSFQEAALIGLNNNYSIAIAKNISEISDNNASLGSAGFLPRVDLTASHSNSVSNSNHEDFSGISTSRSGLNSSSASAGISLNWTIFDGTNMFISYAKYKSLREADLIKFKNEIEDFIFQINSVYFDIVRKNEDLRAAEESLALSEERMKLVEDKYKLGSASRLELLQAQVDYNADKTDFMEIENSLQNSKLMLNALLARDVNVDFYPIDSIVVDQNLILDSLILLADENNSALKIARENINISEYSYKSSNSRFWPKISLFAGYNYSHSTAQTGSFRTNENYGFSYGASLSLNIFDGFNYSRESENAKIQIMNKEFEYLSAKKNLEAELLKSFNSYKNNLELIEFHKINLIAAKENMDIAYERFKLGSYSPFEWREAQKKYIEAKSKLIAAKYNAKINESQLLKLGGILVK